jgi:branched-chain amino acid transport system ATP-binding protein
MSYVTEERSVFKGLTTRDNLRVAGVSPEDVIELFPELEKRMGIRGGLLSGGEQQMLTLGRALARRPRLLLADELSLGLAPLVVDRLLHAVRTAAKEQGTGVLMVEQHAHKALGYADRAILMRRGRIELALSGEEARHRIGEVEQVYLTSAGTSNGAAGAPADDARPPSISG